MESPYYRRLRSRSASSVHDPHPAYDNAATGAALLFLNDEFYRWYWL
jgi:hypothetical protein